MSLVLIKFVWSNNCVDEIHYTVYVFYFVFNFSTIINSTFIIVHLLWWIKDVWFINYKIDLAHLWCSTKSWIKLRYKTRTRQYKDLRWLCIAVNASSLLLLGIHARTSRHHFHYTLDHTNRYVSTQLPGKRSPDRLIPTDSVEARYPGYLGIGQDDPCKGRSRWWLSGSAAERVTMLLLCSALKQACVSGKATAGYCTGPLTQAPILIHPTHQATRARLCCCELIAPFLPKRRIVEKTGSRTAKFPSPSWVATKRSNIASLHGLDFRSRDSEAHWCTRCKLPTAIAHPGRQYSERLAPVQQGWRQCSE